MCFETTKHQRPKIASEDIVCWKVLKRRPTKKGYGAAYNNTIIHTPFYYVPGEEQPLIKVRKVSEYCNSRHYEINEGYHSYSSEVKANVQKDPGEKVFQFIIPKGTRYYHNRHAWEYVSETIVMCKV